MMARLNEPPVSTDSFETLRRKFLRQNREIVRINSNQSQRIRELENDCARMLSENLDLRGQVFHLQKELETNSAQRIADHALQVKAKMETQLEELGSLLAGLGLEPPTKRHSHSGRKIAHAKSGFSRSPRQRKLRNAANDSEAMQEGRLPPIHENKTYPRATLNSEEIQALCSEAADAADSPVLGPPPISRFVDEDQVKVESPRKTADNIKLESEIHDPTGRAEAAAPPPKLDFYKAPAFDRGTKRSDETSEPVKTERLAQETTPSLVSQTLRAGSKRKLGDENHVVKVAKSPGKPNSVGFSTERLGHGQDLQRQRNIRTLSTSGRAHKEKKTQGAGPAATNPRRALATKSTNEDVASPKKQARDANLETIKPGKPHGLRSETPKERSAQRKTPAPVDIPEPPTAPTVATIPAPETPIPDTPLIVPETPGHLAPRDSTRDTPPPSDISSMGETSRPSRRVRASISYAEPNLRDKMRRPSKDLVDAVTGEGKYIHRSGQPKPDDHGPASISTMGSESEVSGNWRNIPAAEALAKEAARRQSVLSPLAAKESTADPIPTTIVTERRKRISSIGTRETLSPMETSDNNKSSSSSRDIPTPATVSATVSHGGDVYDFNTSSPMSNTKDSHDEDEGDPGTITVRQPSKSLRRSSTSTRDISSGSDMFPTVKPPKAPSSRKRASMVALKKGPMLQFDDPDESNGDDEGPMARGRLSRRRSMML